MGIVLFSGNAYAEMNILPSNQLVPGMHGYAKTVIEGDRIDTFLIEIIGVVNDTKDTDGKIIAKASGDLIDKTGGVLQGMSGSPVYIDGKLVGAVSGGWKDIDNRTCVITPIADMMKLWEMPDRKNKSHIKQVQLKNDLSHPKVETEKSKENNTQKVVKDKENEKIKNFSTPLMVSGFSDAGINLLKEKLEPYQLVPYLTGVNGTSQKEVALEPGSSIGVQLVRGDINMAAIGTVTAVEDGKVLAFGHPFLRKGNVNYFMTDAQIIATASGETSGFKIGVPGNVVGRINQDRSAAISGLMGQYPSVVPLRVIVDDVQLGTKKSYAMQIAYDEELLPNLVPAIVYNAMDSSRDRLGYGTVQMSFEIMTNSAFDGKFKRDNMFYNVQDVGQVAIAELMQTLNLLAMNNVEESDIVSIKVNIKVDEERKTASLIEVIPDKPTAKAGETINLKIKMKPYRQAEETLIVPYKIPKNQPEGVLNLEVRGGGLVPLMQVLLQQQGVDLTAQEDKMKPLNVKLDELAKSNKNNEIIVAPAPVMLDEQMANQAKPKKKLKKNSKENEAIIKSKTVKQEDTMQGKYQTAYIIDNALQAVINIVEK